MKKAFRNLCQTQATMKNAVHYLCQTPATMKEPLMGAAKSAFYLFLVLLLLSITSFGVLDDASDPVTWAALIAAGEGIPFGYASQVDIAMTFSLLRDGGINPEHIITFTYKNLTRHPYNPFPGMLKARVDDPDLSETLQKDYTGLDVNAAIILAVLKGDSVAVNGRKVIRSTRRDRIFIYFVGHGERDYLVLPRKEIWTKDSIMRAFWEMHRRGRFNSMVFYVGACYSGCVFEDRTFPDGVYMVGASECNEKTYIDSCDEETWCSSLFSKSWITDSLHHNRKERSIGRQYRQMKKDLSIRCEQRKGFCSTVEYGDKRLKKHKLEIYQGYEAEARNTYHEEI